MIEQAINDGEATLAALAAALDRLSTGIFLLEENGDVRMANEAGRHIAGQADALLLTSTGLMARSSGSSQSIRATLACPSSEFLRQMAA